MIYTKSCGLILLLSVFGLSMVTHEGVRVMVQYSESVATSDVLQNYYSYLITHFLSFDIHCYIEDITCM